ncbi:hypothetical protein MBANPS3_012216, partial [Mucor bainieri]
CQVNTPHDEAYYVQQCGMLPFTEAMSRSFFGGFRSRLLPFLFLTYSENNFVSAPCCGNEFKLASSHQYNEGSINMENMSPTVQLQRLLNVRKFGNL